MLYISHILFRQSESDACCVGQCWLWTVKKNNKLIQSQYTATKDLSNRAKTEHNFVCGKWKVAASCDKKGEKITKPNGCCFCTFLLCLCDIKSETLIQLCVTLFIQIVCVCVCLQSRYESHQLIARADKGLRCVQKTGCVRVAGASSSGKGLSVNPPSVQTCSLCGNAWKSPNNKSSQIHPVMQNM